MTSPASGWYPDPSGMPGERWWDGRGWTNDTRPVPVPPAEAPHGWDGFGHPAAEPAGPPPTYGEAVRYATATDTRAKPSWLARNGYSLGTVGVVAAYLLILAFAGIAILGVLPLFLGIGAVRRREPLAWPALVISVAAVGFGIYELVR